MKIISFDELEPRKGIRYSRVHIARLVKAGGFPAPLQLSPKRIGWREDVLDAWIASRQPKVAA